MNNVSYRVALGGVISSLCVFSMFVSAAVPFLYLTMPMIAGALLTIIVVEVNKSWAFLTYAAVSLLSVFIIPNKEASLIFILLFGYYPILKQPIEQIKNAILRNLTKFILFNIVAVIDFQITIHLLGLSEITEEFEAFGKFGLYIFWSICNVIFFVYDYALNGCIELYVRFIKPKICGNKTKTQ